jgi:hypothetical protein
MRLPGFGGTTPTGQQLIQQALQSGHTVTALARNPARLAASDGLATGLTAAEGLAAGLLATFGVDLDWTFGRVKSFNGPYRRLGAGADEMESSCDCLGW